MRSVVGYDPQLLLTDQRGSALWAAEVLRQYRDAYPHMTEMWKSISASVEDEYIDFEPTYREETTLYVDSTGKVVWQSTERVPVIRDLTPFVSPLRGETKAMRKGREAHQYILGHGRLDMWRLSFPDISETETGWMPINGDSWLRYDFGEPSRVEMIPTDNPQMMLYAYGAYHDEIIRRIAIATGVDYAVLKGDFTKPVASDLVPKKSYLDHDPTKSHKRRKRK